ncbi:MAG: outer membrane beta-barrel protein [Bacteroidota bacterium]|nr:outer membrane beta-barrel protein [Bacteroidota bacterium]MDP4233364.1 outer membrane beta-barrel protein [Bacteroidota bacterium]MDP4242230.1 outer membrane beta-barrel protein [Bacteroidota bacterium]MDP4286986.1 outer membrane beta-barrel protein [Bacteroidota bacterium]
MKDFVYKSLGLLALSLSSLLLSGNIASAQQSNVQNDSAFHIGLGVSITTNVAVLGSENNRDPFSDVTLSAVNFLIPMRFSAFKIEPEIGYVSSSYSSPLYNGSGRDVTFGLLHFGSGFYYLIPVASGASVYIGPKLGIEAYNETDKATDSLFSSGIQISTDNYSRTDFFAGLVFGGEYFFSRAFSMGVEAEVEYLNYGTLTRTTTITPASPSTSQSAPSPTGHQLNTKAAAIARIYF